MNPVTAFLQRYALPAKALVVAALCAVCIYGTYRYMANAADAREAKAVQAGLQERIRLTENALAVSKQLTAEIVARGEDAARHRAEIDAWKAKGIVYVKCPSVSGAPAFTAIRQDAVRFDAGFVDQWNRGMCLGASVPAACYRSAVDAAAGVGDHADAAVDPAGLLVSASDNAASCGRDRARLAAWQELARRNGWAK